MRKFIYLMLCAVFFFKACCMELCNKMGDRIYSGNPLSSNLTTYVYLCRKTPEDQCHCSKNCRDGLSIGIITVDESDGDFIGFDPSITNNIVWTASFGFGYSDDDDRHCSKSGHMDIIYAYNAARYSGLERTEGIQKSLCDDDNYLHDEEGDTVLNPACPTYKYRPRKSDSEFSVLHILRRALFRWKIKGEKLSSFLLTLGNIGTEDPSGSGKKILPRYNKGGIGGYNCATFARRFLAELECSAELRWRVRPVVTTTLLVAAAGDGAVIGSSFGPVGTVAGAGIGILVEGISIGVGGAIKVVSNNTPEAVINFIIQVYADALKEGYDTSDFAIVAHDASEKARFDTSRSARGMFDTYNVFLLKNIREATEQKVKMGKGKDTIFMKEDFQPKDSTCVIL